MNEGMVAITANRPSQKNLTPEKLKIGGLLLKYKIH